MTENQLVFQVIVRHLFKKKKQFLSVMKWNLTEVAEEMTPNYSSRRDDTNRSSGRDDHELKISTSSK